jgi:hypothetical protein
MLNTLIIHELVADISYHSYGLSWNAHSKGTLLSGSGDGLLCAWDVQATAPVNGALQPLMTFTGHKGSVEVCVFGGIFVYACMYVFFVLGLWTFICLNLCVF